MFSLDTLSLRLGQLPNRSFRKSALEFNKPNPSAFTRCNLLAVKHIKKRRGVRCLASNDDRTEAPKSSSQVFEGGKETRRNLTWSRATVIENKAVSADGNTRVLELSIEDHVDFLDGRKMKSIQDSPRWVDDFIVPGQFIGVKGILSAQKSSNLCKTEDEGAEKLLPIVSSPNEARMNSALLDATILEVIVERVPDKNDVEHILSHMGPGDIFQVSQALGRGFASLFSTYVGLQSALEEKRCLLMVCNGASGLGSIRSALNWSPVMALSTTQSVTCILVAPSVESASYVQEWDQWRQNGVNIVPVYQEEDQDLEEVLENAMFGHPETFSTLVKYPMECAVLMSGLTGSASTFLTRRLMDHGVSRERFLFCEYF
eukprot:g959.t1